MIRMLRFFSLALLALFLSSSLLPAADACVSGLKPGQRPGPYAFIVSTGPNRGQLHCFVCETEDRPAVIIFARELTEPLARLVQGVDKAVLAHQSDEMRAWVTFLNEDQLNFDPKVVEWSKEHSLRNVSLGVFEDNGGPPSYLLSRDADVTVLLSVKQKVVHNFAFRRGELDKAAIEQVLKAIPSLVPKKD